MRTMLSDATIGAAARAVMNELLSHCGQVSQALARLPSTSRRNARDMRMSRLTLSLTLLSCLTGSALADATPERQLDPQTQVASSSASSAGVSASGGNASMIAMIDRHAQAAGVPIALARAVVRIESNFNPRITGRAGEVGLMQIKHQTARGMGFTGSRAALYDPETNLRFGMLYLAQAAKLAGGDTCGAVMRYQGGLGTRRMTGAASKYCAQARRFMASN
jgi:soluble lytic murein transglycosylase-like protein